MRRLIIACLASLLLVSCATVTTKYKNPEEEAIANKGQYSRVVFRNVTNKFLYPSSSGIGIEVILDQMLISKLRGDQQSEVFIKKGRHNLMLTHWDIFKFTDNYEIDFTEDDYLIDVYCRPVSTVYEIKQKSLKTENIRR